MSEIHNAVGSYVVNALDPDELEEFEAHLAGCPTCTREVQEFSETAAQFSLLATTAPPPPELRRSILGAISEVRPLPPEPPAATEPAAASTRSPKTMPAERPIDELALRRQQRRTRILSVLVAAVVAAALALGGVVYGLVQSRQAQVAQQAAETELLTAPGCEDLHRHHEGRWADLLRGLQEPQPRDVRWQGSAGYRGRSDLSVVDAGRSASDPRQSGRRRW
jgi:Putative zinc-finger